MPSTLSLPPVLTEYFSAQNAHDIDRLAACFAEDAKVRDEGEDIVGRDKIREWKEKTSAKYKVTVEPLRLAETKGHHSVTAKVSGTFPGSPAELTYDFGLRDGLIATLAVH
jgi:hypothetical protein